MPRAQQPAPHPSPCDPGPWELGPARASCVLRGGHHLSRQVSQPTEPQQLSWTPRNHASLICASSDTRPAVEAPRKVPEASVELGGGAGVRVSRKVRPDLGRCSVRRAARAVRSAPTRGTLPAPRDPPPGREGAVRVRGSDCEAGRQRSGRSAGGVRPRVPSRGVRPRLPGKRPRP